MLVHTLPDGITVKINQKGELFAEGYNCDISEAFGWRMNNADLKDKLLNYVGGLRYPGLYSDHDPDEPSNIRYLMVDNIEVTEVTRIDKLIDAVHKDKLIFCLIEECYA